MYASCQLYNLFCGVGLRSAHNAYSQNNRRKCLKYICIHIGGRLHIRCVKVCVCGCKCGHVHGCECWGGGGDDDVRVWTWRVVVGILLQIVTIQLARGATALSVRMCVYMLLNVLEAISTNRNLVSGVCLCVCVQVWLWVCGLSYAFN